MNCNDITAILDDRDLSRLTAGELRKVETHLAACLACAAEFGAYRAVLDTVVPQPTPRLAVRCRELSSGYSARPVRRAGARPFIVGGLLLVGAAAAAVLSVELWPQAEPDPVPPAPAAATGGSDPSAAAGAVAQRVTADAGAISAGTGSPAEAGAADIGATRDAGWFTVAVTPLRQTASDPEAVRRSEALYRAFTDALRAIPYLELVVLDGVAAQPQTAAVQTSLPAPAYGDRAIVVLGPEGTELTLLESGPRPTGPLISGSNAGSFNDIGLGGQSSEFELPSALIGRIEAVTAGVGQTVTRGSAETVAGGSVQTVTGGSVQTVTGGAAEVYGADAMAGVVNVILSDNLANIQVDLDYSAALESAAEPLAHDFEFDVAAAQSRDTGQFAVSGRSRSGQRVSTSLGFNLSGPADPAEAVEPLIEHLRQNLFPPDAARLEAVRQRVVDPALSVSERLRALDELKRFASRGRTDAIPDRVLFAVVDMAAGSVDANQRAAIWQGLRDVGNPILVAPLSSALLNDASEVVRLQSAITLAGLADDASARAALALAAETDASAEIRMNARWASLDASGKRDYLVATLLDTSLGDSERLAPLLFRPAWSDGGIADLGTVLDAGASRELTSLMRRSDSAEVRASVLMQLDRVASESLLPLYLERLRDDPSDRVRSTAASALRWRLNEPGVRFALEQAAAADPSATVRNAATRVLAIQD